MDNSPKNPSIAPKRDAITMTSQLSPLLLFIACTTTLNCAATEHSSFILLDKAGKPTSLNARCVTLLNSDLSWELKTNDGGVHDKDNIYRWGGSSAEKTGTIFFDDWNSLLNATNAEKLCGFNDWRVPTINELKTLVTKTNSKPVIDTAIFPLTLAMPYWSASTYQNYPEHAQTVDFGTGASNYYNGFRGDRLPLRLVRSNKK